MQSRLSQFVLGLCVLLIGYVFYLAVRQYDPLQLGLTAHTAWGFPLWLQYHAPSFLFVFGFCLLSSSLLGARRGTNLSVALIWLFISSIHESLQAGDRIFSGGIDSGDIFASMLGALVHLVISRFWVSETHLIAWRRTLAICLLGPLALVAIIATSLPIEYSEPVYMSYEELRSDLKIETDRPLRKSGKIYLYQNYLFVSEPNLGIHIFDNTDPSKPIALLFMSIPGNLDIAVKNGHLYADSFIDLVTIDLVTNPGNPQIVSRIENAFPYDPYQAIPEDSGVHFLKVDKSKGVVIGYIR